jgi:hypothetical protein
MLLMKRILHYKSQLHLTVFNLLSHYNEHWGTQQHSCLRHYATRWKVMGSIPNEVTGFFS